MRNALLLFALLVAACSNSNVVYMPRTSEPRVIVMSRTDRWTEREHDNVKHVCYEGFAECTLWGSEKTCRCSW